MKKYIGTKVVKAEPMTMKEAQKVLGRKIATLKPVTVEENGYLNDGIPFDVDRLTISFPKWRQESIKAYGNAWVPQVAYEIFRAIEAEEKK